MMFIFSSSFCSRAVKRYFCPSKETVQQITRFTKAICYFYIFVFVQIKQETQSVSLRDAGATEIFCWLWRRSNFRLRVFSLYDNLDKLGELAAD